MGRMFQDAAGATPVTAAGQPIGLLRPSKSKGVGDLSQSTALSRATAGRWPEGSKPRNLYKDTENLNGSAWIKTSTVITAEGLLTATGTAETNVFPVIRSAFAPTVKVGDTVVMSITAWKDTAGATPSDHFTMEIPAAVTGSTGRSGIFNIATGVVHGTGTGITASIVALGGGKYRCSISFVVQVGWSTSLALNYFLGLYAAQPVGISAYIEDPQIEINTAGASAYQPTDADGVPVAGHGQVRNLANGAQAVSDAAYWITAITVNGVTMTKVGSGLDGGIEHVDIRFQGTATGGSISGAYTSTLSLVAASLGDAFNARAEVKRIAGSNAGLSTGVRVECAAVQGTTYLGQLPATPVALPTNEYQTAIAQGVMSFIGMTAARVNVVLAVTNGAAIDITLRIRGLQFERGLVQTPLQRNYGPNNVTERNVPDVWFAFNDGNDSLNAVLAAGTYQVAYVDVAGNIRYTSVTSDGTAPVNLLFGLRMADLIAIQTGAFTADQIRQFEEYWE